MSKSKKQLDDIVDELLNNRLELTSFVSEGLEQDKHVQELERENQLFKGEKGIKHALNDKAIEIIDGLEQENKRYREAVSVAMGVIEYGRTDKENQVYRILSEASEESE